MSFPFRMMQLAVRWAVTGLALMASATGPLSAQSFGEVKTGQSAEVAPLSDPVAGVDYDAVRVFTDAKGQAVSGQIQGIAAGLITIQRQGGGVIRAKMADLSLDDQKYVEAWYTAKVLARGRAFTFKPERIEGDEKKSQAMMVTVTTQEVHYKVTIKSMSALPLSDLTVVHRTYKKAASAERGVGSDRVYEEGKEQVAKLIPGQEISINTVKQKLESSKLDGDFRYANGNKSRTEDRAGGVWVRIYKGDTVIGEFAEPKPLMELETWDAEEKTK